MMELNAEYISLSLQGREDIRSFGNRSRARGKEIKYKKVFGLLSLCDVNRDAL